MDGEHVCDCDEIQETLTELNLKISTVDEKVQHNSARINDLTKTLFKIENLILESTQTLSEELAPLSRAYKSFDNTARLGKNFGKFSIFTGSAITGAAAVYYFIIEVFKHGH